ncbi:MAG: hypothetical protein WA347_00490 [Rhabdochlamydiaceae bacterium]
MKNHLTIVRKSDLLAAAQGMGLSDYEAETLWSNLCMTRSESTESKVPHVFYFLGAWVICLALAWFMGSRYTLYGTGALLLISIAYATGFMGAGLYLLKAKQKKTLGGLCIFLSISLVPLITYASQDLMGWWPGQFPGQYSDFFCWIKGGWAIMELATIGTSWAALYFIKFPLLTVPLYIALWFMTMDIAALFSHPSSNHLGDDSHLMHIRIALCHLLGLFLIVNAVTLDRAQKTAFGFWGHLFGVAIFWSGITLTNYTGWIGNTLYCLLNVSMIVLSPILERRVFLIFGTIGVVGHLFWLAHKYFADSANFPLILSGIGLLVIIAGWVIQRYWRWSFSQKTNEKRPRDAH